MTTINVTFGDVEVNGMTMTEVIGHIGNGKRPIGRIVMGSFPKGAGSVIKVILAWKKNNPDVTFNYGG